MLPLQPEQTLRGLYYYPPVLSLQNSIATAITVEIVYAERAHFENARMVHTVPLPCQGNPDTGYAEGNGTFNADESRGSGKANTVDGQRPIRTSQQELSLSPSIMERTQSVSSLGSVGGLWAIAEKHYTNTEDVATQDVGRLLDDDQIPTNSDDEASSIDVELRPRAYRKRCNPTWRYACYGFPEAEIKTSKHEKRYARDFSHATPGWF